MEPLQPPVATPLVDFAGPYRAHARDVHRFAVYLSGDPALADDLVSEAFVRVRTARARVDLRNVIRDLLTVYLAGDVSSDSRALVEDWLQRDPELARQVELARRTDLPLFGLAAYVSSLPVSVTFSSRGFEGLLIDNWPERAVVLLLACAL